jgi:multiple sugar transport system substrate-binding protein
MPYTMDAQGQALPIDDLYEKWKQDGRFDDLTEWGQQKFNYNGHYVGVPWQIDARAIFYRTDMFEAAGIQPPTTHDELLAAAKALTDPSKEQYGICVPGKQGSYDTDQFFMTLVYQNGGALADEQGNPTLNTPEQLQALKFEQELVAAAAPPGTAGYSMGETDQLYQQGKCAMVFQPMGYVTPWRLQSQAPEIFAKTGVLPVLKGQGPKATQRIVGFYNPWLIYNQSKHPEEAKQFLDFLMQPENLKKVYSISGGAHGSVFKSLRDDPLYQANPLTAELASQVEQYAVDYWYPNNAAAVGIASMGLGLTDIVINPVLAGARSPEDALQDAQTQLSPLFERHGQ